MRVHLGSSSILKHNFACEQAEDEKLFIERVLQKARRYVAESSSSARPVHSQAGASSPPPAGIPGPDRDHGGNLVQGITHNPQSQTGKESTTRSPPHTPADPHGSAGRGAPGGFSGPGSTQLLHTLGGTGSKEATIAAFSYGREAGGIPGPGRDQVPPTTTDALEGEVSAGTLGGSTGSLAGPSEADDLPGQPQKRVRIIPCVHAEQSLPRFLKARSTTSKRCRN